MGKSKGATPEKVSFSFLQTAVTAWQAHIVETAAVYGTDTL